ncbi:MAG: hypothetical protein SCALA702_30470 [Melioribacteraceae bacterium]|nr:MAG: hypothetical protein SCALA702_30470 [Melioribacteraceae bacterium]
MLSAIKKIFAFLSIFLLYFVVKEFIELYVLISSVNTYAGYIFLVILLITTIYFVLVPLFRIIKLPVYPPPVNDEKDVDELITTRLKHFYKKDKNLDAKFNGKVISDHEKYDLIISNYSAKTETLRKEYVNRVFYSTAISQNGFLDALFVLFATINLIKDIFVIYNGRMTVKDFIRILKNIYYAVLIASSEGVEYAADELLTKLLTDTVKGVPFVTKITGSFADGYVNAALVTRISLITENYCAKLYIKNEKDLFPGIGRVIKINNAILIDIARKINQELSNSIKNKIIGDTGGGIGNPVRYIFSKVYREDSPSASKNEKTGILSGFLNIFSNFKK